MEINSQSNDVQVIDVEELQTPYLDLFGNWQHLRIQCVEGRRSTYFWTVDPGPGGTYDSWIRSEDEHDKARNLPASLAAHDYPEEAKARAIAMFEEEA